LHFAHLIFFHLQNEGVGPTFNLILKLENKFPLFSFTMDLVLLKSQVKSLAEIETVAQNSACLLSSLFLREALEPQETQFGDND
jgi:hypothetical protein